MKKEIFRTVTISPIVVSYPLMNDAEALDLARKGRPEGFRSIWETHGRYLYTLAYRMLRDGALAEDAVQEAFTAAFQSIDGFRGESRLKTWLYSILYRSVLRIQERRGRFNGNGDLTDELPSSRNHHAELETKLDVRTVLDRLPARDRAVLIMAYWDDLTCSEIADVLSTNMNHVKILLYRARSRFASIWTGKSPEAHEEAAS